MDRIPQLGSTAVVTGATGGIGRWIALGLARAGYHVILLGRSRMRGEQAQAWIASRAPGANTELVLADLSSLSETRAAANFILTRHQNLAILINNAGVFDTNPVTTSEGCNRVLATNLLSPFLLINTLLPALQAGNPSRIINLGSSTSDRAKIDPDDLVLDGRWTMRRAYSQSKLGLMMITFALARRLAGTNLVANVVHPGLVASGLVRNGGIIGFVWRCMGQIALTEAQGADTPLYAALAPEFGKISGAYIKDRRVAVPNPRALDQILLERVWVATEQLVSRYGGAV